MPNASLTPHDSSFFSSRFVVGVWGWTCACSRRVGPRVLIGSPSTIVVGSSSIKGGARTLRQNHFLQSVKEEEVLHEMLVLAQSQDMGGHFHFLRGRHNALEACQCKRRVFFSWQVQRFAMRLFALSWLRGECFFPYVGCANVTRWQKPWQGQHFAPNIVD